MVCQVCGTQVLMLNQNTADGLRGFSMTEEHIRAFECKGCQAIIFEDELIDGTFIPPNWSKR